MTDEERFWEENKGRRVLFKSDYNDFPLDENGNNIAGGFLIGFSCFTNNDRFVVGWSRAGDGASPWLITNRHFSSSWVWEFPDSEKHIPKEQWRGWYVSFNNIVASTRDDAPRGVSKARCLICGSPALLLFTSSECSNSSCTNHRRYGR